MRYLVFFGISTLLIAIVTEVKAVSGNVEQNKIGSETGRVTLAIPQQSLSCSDMLLVAQVENVGSFFSFSEEDLLPFLDVEHGELIGCNSADMHIQSDTSLFINGKKMVIPIL